MGVFTEIVGIIWLNCGINEIDMHSFLCKARNFLIPTPQRVLFEHVPKCGGTTVTNYLISQYASKRIFSIDGNNPLDVKKYELVKQSCANN